MTHTAWTSLSDPARMPASRFRSSTGYELTTVSKVLWAPAQTAESNRAPIRQGAAFSMFTTSAVVSCAAGVLALGQSKRFSFTMSV